MLIVLIHIEFLFLFLALGNNSNIVRKKLSVPLLTQLDPLRKKRGVCVCVCVCTLICTVILFLLLLLFVSISLPPSLPLPPSLSLPPSLPPSLLFLLLLSSSFSPSLPPSLSHSPFPSLLGEAEPDEPPPTAEDRQKIFKVREQLGELSSLS